MDEKLLTLENGVLKIAVSDLGAELRSAVREGHEYIWQRDAAFWKNSATVIFPVCGRLFESKLYVGGKPYEMPIHGFAKLCRYEAVKEENTLRFTLTDSEETRAYYPFAFRLTVVYTLEGDTLRSDVKIENRGEGVMPASFGAHPGFNVPADRFSDYSLTFGEKCYPDRLIFSERFLNTGKKTAFPLEGGDTLPLSHGMFRDDAIFLANTAKSVTLSSAHDPRRVTVRFDGFPYLGIWHTRDAEAPFVCIEPWCTLPSYDGEEDHAERRPDMFRILPGDAVSLRYSIRFE